MFINTLTIEGVRNLDSCTLNAFKQLNFFFGDNGAGKTSCLEAIAIASVGRSFRHNKIDAVINANADALSVFLQCQDSQNQAYKIGIRRDKQKRYLVRINGETAKSLARLSYILPTVVLDSTAFQLLDGSPSERRQFIDWGVFHVEHQFYQHWVVIQRLLKQRNALLRQKQSQYSLYKAWDASLAEHSTKLELLRVKFLQRFQQVFVECLTELDDSLLDHHIYYKNGWSNKKIDFQQLTNNTNIESLCPTAAEIKELLHQNFEKDLLYKRCNIGPHRADMQIKADKFMVKDVYSRGQKKTIVAAMKLAQAKIVSRETMKQPILLLDDLPSELDENHLKRFLQHIAKAQYQSFITAVDKRSFSDISHENSQMFHVEHGRIRAVDAQGEAQK